MRFISKSFSALALGCTLLALGHTAQADSGITLVYSTGSHVAWPYSDHRHYAPRSVYRTPVCALPQHGHKHSHRHDYYDRHDHRRQHDRKQTRWIDRHGYHHRDDHGYRGKNRHEARQDRRRDDRGHTAYNSHRERY